MLRRAAILTVALALGSGAAMAVAACGEDRGEVQIEGGTTGEKTSGGSGTSGAKTTKTETAP